MWTRLLLVGAVVASLAGLIVTAAPLAGARDDGIHVTGPYTSGNLTVYLVHGANLLGDKQYLTLLRALEQKKVIVHEQKEVNQLAIQNLSDADLFVQAGEIVKGGQQDRTLGQDLIVSAQSGKVPIPVNCVESGRWTQRGQEASGQFASSNNALASKELKANNYAGNQQGVWESVSKAQRDLGANTAVAGSAGPAAAPTTSPSSLELSLDDAAVQKAAKHYESGINTSAATAAPASDVIGFMYAINGKLDSGDVYASPDLFAKMYPKLLHAAAVEALAKQAPNSDSKMYDAPKPATVEAMLKEVDAAKGEPLPLNAQGMEQQINQQANLPAPQDVTKKDQPAERTAVLKKQTKALTLYESRDTQTKAEFLHRAYLTN